VLHEQAVDEDVAAADFAQEDAFDAIVEESPISPGCCPIKSKKQAECEVLNACSSATE
jgi:hypothetical protein